MSEEPQISVCIPTFRRNERLRAVLGDLTQQSRLPNQVVIVDNDPAGGARAVAEQYCAGAPFRIVYAVQPEPNIALTRNRTVELATGDWIAFIDDDERAPQHWLQELMYAAQLANADGVLAPVEPQVPQTAPAWIRRGRFYDFAHQAEGADVPLKCMRFGNLMLRAARLRAEPGPFDARHGLKAGEDVDLLVRLARRGAKIIWSERAPVFEPIEPGRLSLRWLLRRAFSGGQTFARYTLEGGYKPIGWRGRCLFFLRASLQMFIAITLTVLCLPLGRHRAAAWLITAGANFGKLTVLWGWEFRQYARPA